MRKSKPSPRRGAHRGGAPPPPLGHSSGSALPAAADGDPEAAVIDRPCFTLVEWWLETVEGDDQKIAVAGAFERNQTIQDYPPSPIAKRLTPTVLETEDGAILRIQETKDGTVLHNVSKTFRNGYSETVCEQFLHGFPDCWQSCKLLYPKPTNTHTGADSTQFYMNCYELGNCFKKHVISKFPDILGGSLHNDAVFQKSSHLLNGKPRFEEYACDGDITTNENAAASSEAATGGQKTSVVSLEVSGCCKETQHMSLTEEAAVDDEMPTSVHLGMQISFCLSNRTPILEEYNCNGDIPTNEDAAASNDDNERCTATSEEVNKMAIGLVMGSPSSERGHDDIATDVSLAPTVQCTNNVVSEAVDSTPATDHNKTPMACLKNQGSWGAKQHRASNKKMKLLDSCLGKQPVCRPKKQISPHPKCQSATRSRGTRNPASYVLRPPLTCDKAIPLSMSTPDLKRKRSRSDRKRTTVASLKSQGFWRENQHIASNKKPVDRPQKQISPREKCQSATRSPVTRISISCAHLSLWSPPTRGKDTSWSMTPVEALKLKRSRSGRIMIPKLDEGCQSIAYGTDGSIAGVIGLDSPAVLEWGELKTGRRKKRKTK